MTHVTKCQRLEKKIESLKLIIEKLNMEKNDLMLQLDRMGDLIQMYVLLKGRSQNDK